MCSHFQKECLLSKATWEIEVMVPPGRKMRWLIHNYRSWCGFSQSVLFLEMLPQQFLLREQEKEEGITILYALSWVASMFWTVLLWGHINICSWVIVVGRTKTETYLGFAKFHHIVSPFMLRWQWKVSFSLKWVYLLSWDIADKQHLRQYAPRNGT